MSPTPGKATKHGVPSTPPSSSQMTFSDIPHEIAPTGHNDWRLGLGATALHSSSLRSPSLGRDSTQAGSSTFSNRRR